MGGERKRERPSRDGAEELIPPIITQSVSLYFFTSHICQSILGLISYTFPDLFCTRVLKKILFESSKKSSKNLPISGTRGSSGFGSVRREQIESKTLLIVNAGDHCDLEKNVRTSQQGSKHRSVAP